jgi:hypothetical protein
VDIGASINRSPKGWNGIVPTLTPRMSLWLHQPGLKAGLGDRLLLGEEALQLQGFPPSRIALSTASDSMLRDLAGNAFAATCFLSIYVALLAKMPARSLHVRERHDLAALQILGSLMT